MVGARGFRVRVKLMSTNITELNCPNCRRGLQVPTDQGELALVCPSCGTRWDWRPPQEESASARDADVPAPGTTPQFERTAHHSGAGDGLSRFSDHLVRDAI